jgi:hypothetical protein
MTRDSNSVFVVSVELYQLSDLSKSRRIEQSFWKSLWNQITARTSTMVVEMDILASNILLLIRNVPR